MEVTTEASDQDHVLNLAVVVLYQLELLITSPASDLVGEKAVIVSQAGHRTDQVPHESPPAITVSLDGCIQSRHPDVPEVTVVV